ncbi:sensor domain-containing protein [Planococcus sp. 1R117A]|uniref:sensor domain-containing protein n=1 Tax=Planococcus sp. 1R117A TaxID=3447020 RepID=UPI003EDCA5BA
MKQNIQSKLMEMKSLRSFFESTQQDNLDFVGENNHVIFWSYELSTGEMTVTEGLEKLFGYSPDELPQSGLSNSFFCPESESMEENPDDYISRQVPFDLEYKAVRKDRSTIWVKVKGNPVFDSNKEVIRYNGVSRDITAKVKKEEELAEAAAQYRTLLEQSAQAVYISQDGKFQYATPQMAEITGYRMDELIGMDFDQILDEESIQLVLKRVESYLNGKEPGSQELTVVKKDQTKRIVKLRSSIINYKGKLALMGTLLDITEKKQALELANRLAYYDVLTGLPNRNLLHKKMDSFLEAAQEAGVMVALLFVNLDHFKTITDSFGHQAGDEAIKEAGSKIEEVMPETGFIARYGDNEFVALLSYADIAEIEELAEKMIRDVPLALSGEIKDAPTIGISLFPKHTDSAESLLHFADIAVYQSRRDENRQQHYRFFSPCMEADVLRTNKLANDLKRGVELKQFHLVYQPKVRLDSEKLEGIEALIRWEHPEYGPISPMEFIPLAEKSDHIIGIGDWVLETAIQDMQKVDLPLILNVNVSMKQLLQASFVQKIKDLIERTGFPAERLNLEITESVVAYNIEETIEKLEQIKELGTKISLDDFGTGYSSLSYLTRLPIDCLKIDRSFVSELEVDDAKKTLIQDMIRGAHGLNMEVIAEGIETREQAELLKSYNCEKGQGYYFSKPLLFSDLLNYIHSQK